MTTLLIIATLIPLMLCAIGYYQEQERLRVYFNQNCTAANEKQFMLGLPALWKYDGEKRKHVACANNLGDE